MIYISSNNDRHPVTKTFTPLQYTPYNYTALHFTTLHPTTLHSTSLHSIQLHCTPLHYTSPNYTSLHFTTLHKFVQISPKSANSSKILGVRRMTWTKFCIQNPYNIRCHCKILSRHGDLESRIGVPAHYTVTSALHMWWAGRQHCSCPKMSRLSYVKVKLFVRLTKHHVVNIHAGAEAKLCPFLSLTLDVGEWPAVCPGRFPAGVEYPVYTVGWGVGLDAVEQTKVTCPDPVPSV